WLVCRSFLTRRSSDLVEQAQRGFGSVRQRAPLGVRQRLAVDAAYRIDDAQVPGFREERLVIDETPGREQAVDSSPVAVVTKQPRSVEHTSALQSRENL